ncbi:hypothetical protein INH39_33400 [Massilia violaceinigra]|uniref:Uncharacterized protein n=1 Tax=Massilia violaceinigra TaxID=2045208 RepID=A0ABY4A697_9BURK|nr:hypothetical protein [Massilia violaceinigra]UOD30177.1 hypothetical protein INH39_33400 [Massilia violaceinigra]
MKLTHLLLLLALTGSSATCLAHRDSIVNISPEGMMDAIPAAFGPARMNVVFAAPDAEQAVESVTLQLGRHVTMLPACIVALLPSRKMAQVSASASWYHLNADSLPHYLSLRFAAPGAVKAGTQWTYVGMLVNLRTAKIINIKKVLAGPAEGEQHPVGAGLLQGCSAQELDAVFDPAHRLNAQ